MTVKMMESLKAAGIAKEWNHGDMHRMYIDLDAACEMYYDNNEHFQHGRIAVNRYERVNGKIWVDMHTCEINTKGIGDSEEVISQIMELAAYLTPDEIISEDAESEESSEETTEAVSTSDTLETGYKYIVDINYYRNGSGYSHTETFDIGYSDGIITAESWYNVFMSQCDDPLYDAENGWIIINVRVYRKGADPMFDDPIAESEYCPD